MFRCLPHSEIGFVHFVSETIFLPPEILPQLDSWGGICSREMRLQSI